MGALARMKQVAVIGAAVCTDEEYRAAEQVGGSSRRPPSYPLLSRAWRGYGGISKGGTTVGIIPGISGENLYSGIVIRTGMGHAGNIILVQSADAVIAIGGSYGTLSEIAAALKMGKPVFGYHTWEIPGVVACDTPDDAVIRAVGAGDPSLTCHTPRDGQESQ